LQGDNLNGWGRLLVFVCRKRNLKALLMVFTKEVKQFVGGSLLVLEVVYVDVFGENVNVSNSEETSSVTSVNFYRMSSLCFVL